MRNYVLICLALFLYGCQIKYEDNLRLLVTGTLLDQYNNPVSSAALEVYASASFSNDVLIGSGTTMNDGSFRVIIISPENAGRITLRVNGKFLEDYNSDFVSLEVNGLEDLEIKENTLPIPKLVLDKRKATNLVLTRTNTNDTLFYSVTLKALRKSFHLINPESLKLYTRKYSDSITGTLLPDEAMKIIDIIAVESDTINLFYKNTAGSGDTQLLYDSEKNEYRYEF